MIDHCCPHDDCCYCDICRIKRSKDCVGPMGPQGPRGPIGPAGPRGSIGPIGPRGPMGLTGADGPPGSQGIQGKQGPIGPAGADGPQGIQGIQGPKGPMGVAGANGPPGPQGLAATISVENASGVPFDDMPYVVNVGTQHNAILKFGIPSGAPGAKGDKGSSGEDGRSAYQIAVDNGFIGTETEWLNNLKGETGPQGEQGEKGERGEAGPAGEKGEKGERGEAGPSGEKGEQGERGEAGPPGEKGEAGPIAACIPFSISKYGVNLETDAQGVPLAIAFSGFSPSYYSATYLQEGEWNTGTITVHDGMPYPTSFIMPYNGLLQNIYLMFSVTRESNFTEDSIIQPFVCLAISDSNGLVYRILDESLVYTEPYTGGTIPAYSIRRGAMTGLNIELPEGTLVAIVAGIKGTNVTDVQSSTFIVNGGIYLE